MHTKLCCYTSESRMIRNNEHASDKAAVNTVGSNNKTQLLIMMCSHNKTIQWQNTYGTSASDESDNEQITAWSK
jgi:hypothetical protein